MSRALLIGLAALVVSACGDEAPSKPPPKVRVALTAPGDAAVVDGDRVELRGTVAPARARVEVLGLPVDASGGAFATEVQLDPGANVIDVAASAEGRSPAVTAVRVVRRMPLTIPDVDGQRPDTAIQRLEALGLDVAVHEGGGILDDLLGGDQRACGTEPEAGSVVRPGTSVTVEVQRDC